MAKQGRHIDSKYNLSGPWLKAYNEVADCLGGDGYAYYDIDIKKLVNPDETKGKLYLNFVTYVLSVLNVYMHHMLLISLVIIYMTKTALTWKN